jgi:hypothetical protein
VVGAVARRQKSHTPGSGYEERVDTQSGSGGSAAGIALEDRTEPTAGPVAVEGSFTGDTDWAFVGLELLPAGCPIGGCAQSVPTGSVVSWTLTALGMLGAFLWLRRRG